MIIKPNRSERLALLVVGTFVLGLVVGVLSMKRELDHIKFENKLMMYRLEETTEIIEQMLIMSPAKDDASRD
tara:strand:- start:273 stop:488 length:216 start_codon:yes stop_codon:yes gene_type:complete